MPVPILCEQGPWGPKVTLTGEWSPAVSEFIRTNGIRQIELNHAKGWRGAGVDFLDELPQIDALTIIDFSIKDIKEVHTQTHLKYLDLNTYAQTIIDFSKFQILEECAFEWSQKSVSLFDLTGLKRIFINKFPEKNFEIFSRLTNLTHLSLASPSIVTLKGIERLKKLTFLGIYEARKLVTIAGIDALQSLDTLEVNGCKQVHDISPLAGLLRLRRLLLCNDGGINTFLPLAEMAELEELLFYESTNVLDGDLSVLTQLRKLRNVTFMDRKHYSHRRENFMKSSKSPDTHPIPR